nr:MULTISPECIES: nucleotide disphospho-sugar-binding domain-containing protein [unclassified Burkholderia]
MIITAIGSAGDVHPMLGIGAALASRGHRVTFCSHPQYAETAARRGFSFVPVGTAEAYAMALADPALWDPHTSFPTLWQAVAPMMRPHFDALSALVDDDTVLIGTLWAFSARLMQERYGTPFVLVQSYPSAMLSAYAPPTLKGLTVPGWLPLVLKRALITFIERGVIDRVCGPELNAVRAGLGLPEVKRILGRWLPSKDGVLCLFPSWFAADQPDWPENRLLSGFPLFNDIADVADDAELDAFITADEAPVVFTAGSTRVDLDHYLRMVNETLAATGLRGILLAPDLRDTRHDKLLIRSYVPLRTLLPRCRALVHHAGVGTAALAYEAGVPQVLTPFAHDQFDNAQRVAASGCGVVIDELTNSDSLIRGLKQVLDDETLAAQCQRHRTLVTEAPNGCEVSARFIERVIHSSFPPVDTRLDLDRRPAGSPHTSGIGQT